MRYDTKLHRVVRFTFWRLGECAVTIFTNPSARAGYDTRSIFKRSLTGLNSEFSFSLTSCLTRAEEPSLPDYLPIAGGRIIGFIPFQRFLVLCEMQSASSRIWTRVAVFISYDDNHYTTGTLRECAVTSLFNKLLLMLHRIIWICKASYNVNRDGQNYLNEDPFYFSSVGWA